jgi:hypothetical protein
MVSQHIELNPAFTIWAIIEAKGIGVLPSQQAIHEFNFYPTALQLAEIGHKGIQGIEIKCDSLAIIGKIELAGITLG